MRKLIALLTLVCLLMSLPACSLLPGGSGSDAQQDTQQSSNNNATENEDSDNSIGSFDNGDTSVAFDDEWPIEFDFVPEFTYGEIVNVIKVTDTFEGIEFTDYQITFDKAGEGAAEKYASDLDNASFDMPYEPYEVLDPMTDTSYLQYEYEQYAFETEDTLFYISVDFWINNENAGAVYISVPHNPGTGNSQDQTEDSQQDSDLTDITIENGDSEYNWGNLSESDIPEGYPSDDVPLIGLDNGGVLLGASRQDMGDMGTAYIIVFGIDDDVDTVSDTIGSQLEEYITSQGGTFQSIIGQMFMGEINGCEYTVAIGDGSADGFVTVVDYTVICS